MRGINILWRNPWFSRRAPNALGRFIKKGGARGVAGRLLKLKDTCSRRSCDVMGVWDSVKKVLRAVWDLTYTPGSLMGSTDRDRARAEEEHRRKKERGGAK